MFEILPGSHGRLVGIRLIGALTEPQSQELQDELKERIAAHGKVDVLLDLAMADGIDLVAAWDDLLFTLKNIRHVDRLALIADEHWVELTADLADWLSTAEVRFFPTANTAEAWTWLSS